MARVDAPACDSSATVLESYPSTARRPLLCAVLQPLHPYAYSTYRQIFARFGRHLEHTRLLDPRKRTAADPPSVGSVGPWRYRCGYSEYANTRAAHHCTAAHSRLSEVRAPLTPQLAVAAGLRLGTTECAEAQFRGSERIILNESRVREIRTLGWTSGEGTGVKVQTEAPALWRTPSATPTPSTLDKCASPRLRRSWGAASRALLHRYQR